MVNQQVIKPVCYQPGRKLLLTWKNSRVARTTSFDVRAFARIPRGLMEQL